MFVAFPSALGPTTSAPLSGSKPPCSPAYPHANILYSFCLVDGGPRACGFQINLILILKLQLKLTAAPDRWEAARYLCGPTCLQIQINHCVGGSAYPTWVCCTQPVPIKRPRLNDVQEPSRGEVATRRLQLIESAAQFHHLLPATVSSSSILLSRQPCTSIVHVYD
ncbi:hypothetical protein Y032_0015g2789 [Ancylostoma ceylanicum]|uniref:Uncharacterized protein n=1 Tax=Ancylostoma ceylanicum TaxID=53326 RepID=A0A016VAE1_9BILA|nr:hypothetical protein Y032_0015g2789 [Ancylostoma ceylanicum]